MRGVLPPLSEYVFIAWYLVKHRDNFTFTFAFTLCIYNALDLFGTYVTVTCILFEHFINISAYLKYFQDGGTDNNVLTQAYYSNAKITKK
jgi:hypothetical protein